ncbi:MAG: hypothetical protein HYY63_06170 [Elusimicrobia bacterium]|nr:hypothetical protein [Elusimicrobiota bacterium]MBI3013194.1 hypothetical protein [Elusimicrobiota bacterium]MBI4218413.1 hypothetical protein [Elusimicrobiota bacterium]
MDEKVLIDLNEIFPAKTSVQNVQQKLSQWDVSPYKGKKVQLKGCSPTWAHLMVMGKLVGTAETIDFLIDDSKNGIPVPVYPA